MANGIGRSYGKRKILIMAHAITKEGPLVNKGEDGFPIPDGPFKPAVGSPTRKKSSPIAGKKRQQSGGMGSPATAEFLWQEKHGLGDYHNSMTDKMFMEFLERSLSRWWV